MEYRKCFVFGNQFRFSEMKKGLACFAGMIGKKEQDEIAEMSHESFMKISEQKGYFFIEDLSDKCFWIPEEVFDMLCNTQNSERSKSFIEIVCEKESSESIQAVGKYRDRVIAVIESLIEELKK